MIRILRLLCRCRSRFPIPDSRPLTFDNHLHDRVCLITGASRGIGKATALELARLGATLVLLGRDAVRCAHACEEVRRESSNENVTTVPVELASGASIRAAAATVARRFAAVHVLVNNAGVNLRRRARSVDGFEMTLAVNHLGPFLLTNLLLPQLRAGAPSRIVNVTSRFERLGRIHFDDLQLERRYGATRAYTQSKLANVLFTYEVAERLAGTGVTANCVHPGVVATDLMREWPRWMRAVWNRFLLTPAQAARRVTYLAASPEVDGVTGAYFERVGRPAVSSRRSHDRDVRKRLWRESAAMTGLEASP